MFYNTVNNLGFILTSLYWADRYKLSFAECRCIRGCYKERNATFIYTCNLLYLSLVDYWTIIFGKKNPNSEQPSGWSVQYGVYYLLLYWFTGLVLSHHIIYGITKRQNIIRNNNYIYDSATILYYFIGPRVMS